MRGSLLEQDAVDERANDLVESPEVPTDDGARDDDDDDALERLAPSRPVDLLELGIRLAHELPAGVLRAPSGLLLDGLLSRPDLSLAAAAGSRSAVSGGGPGGAALPACLACHGATSSPCAVYGDRTSGSTSGTPPGQASCAS